MIWLASTSIVSQSSYHCFARLVSKRPARSRMSDPLQFQLNIYVYALQAHRMGVVILLGLDLSLRVVFAEHVAYLWIVTLQVGR